MHIDFEKKKQFAGKTSKFIYPKKLSCKIVLPTTMDFQMMEKKLEARKIQYKKLCAKCKCDTREMDGLTCQTSGKSVEGTVCSLLHSLCTFYLFRYDKMPRCRQSHPPALNNGVFQAIVALGTHPVYLNPSAHSAVKPWHGGSSTPILHPCIWQ